jgi:DNA-binding CsgD family transcriptional regulator
MTGQGRPDTVARSSRSTPHRQHGKHAALIADILRLLPEIPRGQRGQRGVEGQGGLGGRPGNGGGSPPCGKTVPPRAGGSGGDRSPGATQSPRLVEPLSRSEIRVLHYLPTNLPAGEIARELSVSVNTVRTHMRHLFTKLSVHRRTEASPGPVLSACWHPPHCQPPRGRPPSRQPHLGNAVSRDRINARCKAGLLPGIAARPEATTFRSREGS